MEGWSDLHTRRTKAPPVNDTRRTKPKIQVETLLALEIGIDIVQIWLKLTGNIFLPLVSCEINCVTIDFSFCKHVPLVFGYCFANNLICCLIIRSRSSFSSSKAGLQQLCLKVYFPSCPILLKAYIGFDTLCSDIYNKIQCAFGIQFHCFYTCISDQIFPNTGYPGSFQLLLPVDGINMLISLTK